MSKTKALEIEPRHCRFTNLNIRLEKHGDDDVPAVDLKFEDLMLRKDELNRLLGEKFAHDALFRAAKEGGLIEPLFPMLAPLALEDKFEDCTATVAFGLNDDFTTELEDVKFRGVRLKPVSGGMTAITLTVQYELDDSELMSSLTEFLGRECKVGLVFGKKTEAEKKQQKLALNDDQGAVNKFGDGDGDAPATH